MKERSVKYCCQYIEEATLYICDAISHSNKTSKNKELA